MSRPKASTAQLAFLSEFMKTHPEMAMGHISSLQGRADLESVWLDLTTKLNAMGGAIKTVSKWKQAWRDLKTNVKKKAAHNKNEFRGYGPGSTGNGPSTLKPLTEIEEQVFSVMGPVAVYGMQDVVATEPIELTTSPRSIRADQLPVLLQETHSDISPMPGPSVEPELSPMSGPSAQPEISPMPGRPAEPTHQAKKRRRVAPRQDSFDTKLVLIENEKIKIEKERNNIMERRNCIAEEKNAALNRIASVLEDISNTLNQK